MLKISYAGCLGLTPAISSQFSIEMCAASKYCEKFTINPFWEGSRSFKIIDVNYKNATDLQTDRETDRQTDHGVHV